jgi:threonine/homoserine/homoserine lactone efflux protein
VTNLLNPKMVVFTVALLPQFVRPELGSVWAQFAILGAILVVFEFLVDGTVGVLAGRIGSVLRRRRAVQRGLDVTVGGIFIGLGVRLRCREVTCPATSQARVRPRRDATHLGPPNLVAWWDSPSGGGE